MKKTLAIFLVFCLCIGLSACVAKNEPETHPSTPLEKVEASKIYASNVNIAAMQQYVGKETTIIGSISSISVDYCLMDVMYTYEKAAKVFMETSVLANLNKGDIKVVTGVIASAEEDGYIIDEARIEEQNVADEVIHNYINQISHYPRVMFMNHNMFLIGQCMSEHPEKYGFSSQAETEAFMTATWEGFQYNPNGTGRNIYNLKMSPTGAMINGSLVQVSGNIQLTYYSNVKAPHIYFSSVNKGIYESGDLYKMSETYMLIYSCNYWTGSETWCLLERSK